MVSVRKRKANKSSIKKVSRRSKDKSRNINIASNPIIEKNWDYSLTLSQNYKKLGLKSKLSIPAGGIEADLSHPILKSSNESYTNNTNDGGNKEIIQNESELTEFDIPLGEARIIRDSNGEVLKVIYGKKTTLDDDLNLRDDENDNSNAAKTQVVKQLEDYANSKTIKTDRIQSEREKDWISALYAKYGDDYAKMKWDKKLNIHQQSEGDLRRRLLKWKKKYNVE